MGQFMFESIPDFPSVLAISFLPVETAQTKNERINKKHSDGPTMQTGIDSFLTRPGHAVDCHDSTW